VNGSVDGFWSGGLEGVFGGEEFEVFVDVYHGFREKG
jgi:hypothetical protein